MKRTDCMPDTNDRLIARNLAVALVGDPLYIAISVDFSADPESRLRGLEGYFAYSMDEGRRLGRCIVAKDCEDGAAVWLLPAEDEVRRASAAAKRIFLQAHLGPRGAENYHRIVDFMAPRAREVMAPGAWYLSIIGVSPTAQGQGLGAKLLEPTLREADTAGAVCYLETYSAQSLPFYHRLGFRSVGSHIEPVTGSEYWILSR